MPSRVLFCHPKVSNASASILRSLDRGAVTRALQGRAPPLSRVVCFKSRLKDLERLVHRAARQLGEAALRDGVLMIKEANRINGLDPLQHTPRAPFRAQRLLRTATANTPSQRLGITQKQNRDVRKSTVHLIVRQLCAVYWRTQVEPLGTILTSTLFNSVHIYVCTTGRLGRTWCIGRRWARRTMTPCRCYPCTGLQCQP